MKKKSGKKSIFRRIFSLKTLLCVVVCLALVSHPLYRLFKKSDTYHLITSPAKRRGQRTSPRKISVRSRRKLGKPRNPKSEFQSRPTLASRLNSIRFEYGEIPFMEQIPRMEYNKLGFLVTESIENVPTIDVPDTLKDIVGLVENISYQTRIDAVDALEQMNSQEIRALIRFLHKKPENDYLKPIDLNAIKNQAVLALMRQVPFPQELALHLIGMYHNEDIDLTWRDYCIQFLGQIYKSIGPVENKLLARKTMFDALENKRNIAASAIIAIEGLSKQLGFNDIEIANSAFELASSPESSHIVKIPALQIATKFNHPLALDLARDFLSAKQINSSKNPAPRAKPLPVILKMSAIAAIGAKGNQNDIQLLLKYRKSPDVRLRTAAKAAMKKLKRKSS